MTKTPTTRFSSSVADAIHFRPSYPLALLDVLAESCHLAPESIIANIGSGTGQLSKLFLENGNLVIGIEPNKEMREAGDVFLEEYAQFKSLDASAEATRLPAQSIDIVIAGQAFHRFDREKARIEFMRILKPEGYCALVWNQHRLDESVFLRDYEKLMETYPAYQQANHQQMQTEARLSGFLAGNITQRSSHNTQHLDLAGFISRTASCSYVPERNTPEFIALEKALTALFHQHAINNRVAFEYDTRVYFGQIR